jgi:hypothetical protein
LEYANDIIYKNLNINFQADNIFELKVAFIDLSQVTVILNRTGHVIIVPLAACLMTSQSLCETISSGDFDDKGYSKETKNKRFHF